MTGKRNTFSTSFSASARAAGLLALAVLILSACRAEEQGRVVRYEPGVYKGKPDTQVSEDRLQELRERARLQGAGAGVGSLGGGAASGDNVRPPADSGERLKLQGGVK